MSAAGDPGAPMLGVLVPARDEADVIERKLANLARCALPPARAPHAILVVDDGSSDGTGALARAAAERCFAGRADVAVSVIDNRRRPGKSGALECGIAHLGLAVDLIVLTDADVVIEAEALTALAAAFAREPELGMACGAQRFVRDLAADGTCRGADFAEPQPAAGRYDRLTARVRERESRRGVLFSVHGQLLAWRADLQLAPAPGMAADDLDLMLAVRGRGRAVRLVAAARFLEVKAPAGAEREKQALRRARAYVQCVRGPAFTRARAHSRGLARAQLWAYGALPTAVPWLLPSGLAAAAAALVLWAGPAYGLAFAGLAAACAASPAGRALAGLCRTIVRAGTLERSEALPDRWQTARR